MRCRDVGRLTTAYVDGELDERRSRAVRGHLRTCLACAGAIADEAALRRAAARLGPLEPPASMWRAIEARLADDEIAESRRGPLGLGLLAALDRLRRHALPAAVAVSAALLAALWLFRSDDERLLDRAIVAAPAGSPPSSPTAVDDPSLRPRPAVEAEQAAELEAATAHHRAVIAELEAEVDALAPSLGPAARAELADRLADSRGQILAAPSAEAALAASRRHIAALTSAVTRGGLAVVQR